MVRFHAQAALTLGKDFPVLTNRESQEGAVLVWSGGFIAVSYFKIHNFQNELMSNTYAFDINLASRGSSANDVTGCGLVDRLPFMAKLKISLLYGQR